MKIKCWKCGGNWDERVPVDKRFALCERIFDGKAEYNAIDLVCGYMSQRYWDYWSWGDVAYNFYREDIRPLLTGSMFSEIKMLKHINGWSPYKVGESTKFGIVDYEETLDGRFVIRGVGKKKTLAEHQRDLKKIWTKYMENRREGSAG